MTAPSKLDEARLRELAEAGLKAEEESDFQGMADADQAIFETLKYRDILALLDALSAERERGADMQRRLDMWEPKPTSGSSIAVSSRIGGNNAPLATQKAEGA